MMQKREIMSSLILQ